MHTFRTSLLYLSELFISVEELLFPCFRTYYSQFLNFLYCTIKTSWILFQNIFSEFLLSHFGCSIFTHLEHVEYIFQNFLSEFKNIFFPYFRTYSSKFLNILYCTIKTSWILFKNIFSELLLSHFECFIFTPLEHL